MAYPLQKSLVFWLLAHQNSQEIKNGLDLTPLLASNQGHRIINSYI
jgi:hypothetical protein